MRTLVLGGGAREDAIAHALARSRAIGELHAAPGNPGIARVAELHPVDQCSPGEVWALCEELGIELVVIGPEAPLAAGVADRLRADGVRVFGPGADGARLESSKAFAKRFMRRFGIPTAAFECCVTLRECERALAERRPPYVVKADGLAAGKGVFICGDADEALDACRELLEMRSLGDAGSTVVIEDFTEGAELTVLAMTDGRDFIILPASRDHKRIYDGNRGPNTGGMGAFSPVADADEALLTRVRGEIIAPTIKGLAAEGISYCGVIYAGLMLKPNGGLSLLEYNVRMGDPETQVVLHAFGGDFGEAVIACCDGAAGDFATRFSRDARFAVGVVLASAGYPGSFGAGYPISGLGDNLPGTHVYHAGTKYANDGSIVTSGGRVLTVVGVGETPGEARRLAYERTGRISFEGAYRRSDIAADWEEKD